MTDKEILDEACTTAMLQQRSAKARSMQVEAVELDEAGNEHTFRPIKFKAFQDSHRQAYAALYKTSLSTALVSVNRQIKLVMEGAYDKLPMPISVSTCMDRTVAEKVAAAVKATFEDAGWSVTVSYPKSNGTLSSAILDAGKNLLVYFELDEPKNLE
jgi:hypothetical protein